MKTSKFIRLSLVSTLVGLTLSAQQDPMFTHYMDNTLIINPAYAGSREALTVVALHRSQWVDFKGAPVSQTITMHAPLKNEHIGVGLSFLNDKIGPSNRTSLIGNFAYIMKTSAKSKLAIGLNGGVNIYQARLNSLNLDQQSDPVFQNNISNHVTPTFGFGAYYYRERFYAGISTPNLIQNSYSVFTQANGNSLTALEHRHYYFIAGALFNLSDNLAFKPTTFIKVTAAAPIEADLTASFIFVKKLSLGIMYRTGDAFGGLVGFNITDQFHIGYSYDWSFGLKTSNYNMGSHELFLRYDFIYASKKQIHSPRYF